MSIFPADLDKLADPLASPILQQELPGCTLAFDTVTMRAQIQALLLGPPNTTQRITECAIEQATYLPDVGCVVRYELTITDGQGDEHAALVSAQVFPTPVQCAAFVRERLTRLAARATGHPQMARFSQPIGMIEPAAIALFAFPIDGDMPSLLDATDNRYLLSVLGPLLPQLGLHVTDQSACRAELVDYGRARRCTLRYRLSGLHNGTHEASDAIVYGKLTGDGSGALAGAVSSALSTAGQRTPARVAFRVPQVLAWRADMQLSLLEMIPGADVIGDLLKARLRDKPAPEGAPSLEAAIVTCAQIGAALHSSGIGLGQRRALDDELAALRAGLAQIERISPAFAAQLALRYDQIAAVAQESAALPLCFNHGDFTAGQFLFGPQGSGLIDFDSVCQAEPALDVAQFLTYLTVGGQKSKRTPEETQALFDDLRERFLAAYLAAGGPQAPDPAQLRARVALYGQVSLLRRMIRSWQKMKPGRIGGALEMLDVALERR